LGTSSQRTEGVAYFSFNKYYIFICFFIFGSWLLTEKFSIAQRTALPDSGAATPKHPGSHANGGTRTATNSR